MSEEATNLRAELEVASEASKASEAAMDALRAEAAEAVRRRREALQAAVQQLAVQRAWAYDLPESPQPQPTLPEPNLEETRGLDDDEVNGSLPGGEAAKKVDGTEGKADETADDTMVAQVEEKAEDVVDESNAVVEMPKDRGVDDHRDGRTVAAAVAAAVASALVTVGDEAAARQEVAVAAAVAAGHVVTKEATRRADERAATDVRESVRAEVLEEIRLGALMTASSMVPFTPFPSGYFAREAAVAAVVDSRGRDAGSGGSSGGRGYSEPLAMITHAEETDFASALQVGSDSLVEREADVDGEQEAILRALGWPSRREGQGDDGTSSRDVAAASNPLLTVPEVARTMGEDERSGQVNFTAAEAQMEAAQIPSSPVSQTKTQTKLGVRSPASVAVSPAQAGGPSLTDALPIWPSPEVADAFPSWWEGERPVGTQRQLTFGDEVCQPPNNALASSSAKQPSQSAEEPEPAALLEQPHEISVRVDGSAPSEKMTTSFNAEASAVDEEFIAPAAASASGGALNATLDNSGFDNSGFDNSGFGAGSFGDGGFDNAGFVATGFGDASFGTTSFGETKFDATSFGDASFGAAFGSSDASLCPTTFGDASVGAAFGSCDATLGPTTFGDASFGATSNSAIAESAAALPDAHSFDGLTATDNKSDGAQSASVTAASDASGQLLGDAFGSSFPVAEATCDPFSSLSFGATSDNWNAASSTNAGSDGGAFSQLSSLPPSAPSHASSSGGAFAAPPTVPSSSLVDIDSLTSFQPDDTESLLDDPFQLTTSSAADLYDGEIDAVSAALLDDPFGSTPMCHEPVSSVQPLRDVGPISESQQASSAVAQPSDAATDAKLESLLGELQW